MALNKKAIFITGTDTGVGKSVTTAGIASLCVNSGLKTAVMKPVQTGVADSSPDLRTIHDIVPGLVSLPEDLIAPYVFQLSASPHLAAEEENKSILPEKIKKAFINIMESDLDVLLVEGSGGVLVPITDDYLMLDLIKELGIPVIVVVSAGLGTINHTLLTVRCLNQADIEVSGIIINKLSASRNNSAAARIETDNVKTIARLSKTPILGVIHDIDSSKKSFSEAIVAEFSKQLNLSRLIVDKIGKIAVIFLLTLAVCISPSNVFAQEKKLSAQKFLNIAQHPPGVKTWAQLEGTATHKRKGKPVREAPIYLGIRFTPEQTFAQVTINKDETYRIGQSYYSKKEKVTVISEGGKKKSSILADFGIKPDDLTMSFLFWTLKKELPMESVKAQNCRVFLLESPDKKEVAKTFISSKYLFPLRVEWTRINEKEPYRMMEITSFKKVNSLWLIDAIMVSGPGWRTKVEFSKCNAGMVEKGIPKNLFRDIK